MKFLNGTELKLVAGASGAYDPSWARVQMKKGQHTTYGGQGGGFVGTNSCGMDLGNLIRNNPCVAGIVAGALSGATSVPGLFAGL